MYNKGEPTMPRSTFERRAYSDEEIEDITSQLIEELDALKKELNDGLNNNKSAQKRARKLTKAVADTAKLYRYATCNPFPKPATGQGFIAGYI